MKKVNKCETENCIPTQSSCVEWNGGSIEYLGICNGDSLNTLVWEIVTKLEDIAGSDLSQFDIDSLTDICNQNAPQEVTLLSILNLLKNNQVCLKDFIDDINERLEEIFANTGVTVDLKCYSQFDNLGNSLAITRETLDQLVIDNLCSQKLRLDTVEGKIINIQSQIDNLNNTSTVEELTFGTCVDPTVKPTSSQVISIANAHCDLEDATGSDTDIASALANTPSNLNTEFGLISGWILVPANWAENYNNMILMVENLRQRINTIEDTCCALTCDDVEIGFAAGYNEDGDGLILRFTYGNGTSIPAGFTDAGSYGTITDQNGDSVDFNVTISNNLVEDVSIVGLNTFGPLEVSVTAIMSTGSITCQKCISRKVDLTGCEFCQYTAVGDGEVSIIYESDINYSHGGGGGVIYTTSTTTTTTTGGT